MSGPQVVAVVLHWQREEETVRAVSSLLASSRPVTVLVVDNGSADGSGARLRERFPRVHHLRLEENLGFTGGCNRGIDWARARGARYVLLLNDDAVVEEETVDRLVEVAEEEREVGAVAPKILHRDRPGRIWYGGGRLSRMRGLGIHLREGEPDRGAEESAPREVTFVTGCCVLLSLPALDDVGPFPDDFFAYGEDVDLSLRLLAGGYRLLYEPRARAHHRSPPGRTRETPFQIVQRDRNRRRLARRRFSIVDRALFSAFFYPSRIVRLVQYVVRGDLPRAGAILRGMTVR